MFTFIFSLIPLGIKTHNSILTRYSSTQSHPHYYCLLHAEIITPATRRVVNTASIHHSLTPISLGPSVSARAWHYVHVEIICLEIFLIIILFRVADVHCLWFLLFMHVDIMVGGKFLFGCFYCLYMLT